MTTAASSASRRNPLPGTEISRQVNTGIYIFEPGIFELIPAGDLLRFCPRCVPGNPSSNTCLSSPFPVQGYWTDIGNPGEYLRANLDFLAGRIRVEGCGERGGDNFLAPAIEIDAAQLSSCIVGAHAVLAAGVELTRCVVWPHTVVTEPVNLNDAILTPHGIFKVEGKNAVALAKWRRCENRDVR